MTTLAGSKSFGSNDGTYSAAQFGYWPSIAADLVGNIVVCDWYNHKIRKITSLGVTTTLAGSGAGNQDGTGTNAAFYYPRAIGVSTTGMVYLADTNNHKIRAITSSGVVTTFVGAGGCASVDGVGASVYVCSPNGVTVDPRGNVYSCDSWQYSRIRKFTSAGVSSTFAGWSPGFKDGTGTNAAFYVNGYCGLAADSLSNIYVADWGVSRVRKITSLGLVTTIAGGGSFVDGSGTSASLQPMGIAVDKYLNIFVADWALTMGVRMITSAGVVTTYAGSSTATTFQDGSGTSMRFGYTSAVAVDSSMNVYTADYIAFAIRKISQYGRNLVQRLYLSISIHFLPSLSSFSF